MRQTVQNETRERALKDLETPLNQLPIKELATLTSERHMLISLAQQTGRGLALLDELWSSDVTELRAAAVVSAAQTALAHEHAEHERKKANRSGRRRGR